MKLRKSVLVLLFFTVLAPLVLYTDRLRSFSTFSANENELLQQEASSMGVARDSGMLNLLVQESSTTLKEPFGVVYSDNLTMSISTSAGSNVENVGRTRASSEDSQFPESVEHKSRALYMTDDADQSQIENPIRQVTNGLSQEKQNGVMPTPESASIERQRDEKKTNRPTLLVQNSNNAIGNMKINIEQQSGENRGESSKYESLETKRMEKEQMFMPDARVRRLKDQIIRARIYLSFTATRNNPQFIRELKLRIREVQRALGSATRDSELPRNVNERLKAMDQTLAKGKQIQDDCAAVVKKLRAMLHSTEEQLRVHKKQTLFLTQLTAKTFPKGLHCLPLRLSSDYFAFNSSEQQFPEQDKIEDPRLYHYAIFSDNVMASAVVINSTVTHAKDPSRHVFHIVTDRLNYAAMRMWFLSNPPRNATMHIQYVEEFMWLNSSYSPVLRQLGSPSTIDYYFKNKNAISDANLKFRNPKYLSILNHIRFYLPEIFPNLNKVLFLDDDVVVQKDLSGLWSIDLKGNVNGAVETCGENFHRFDQYLNFSNPLISKNFDPRACGWAYGMNIFDLHEWRRQNLTEVYHSWQKLNHDRQLWKLGTLPAGLITFWRRTYALDKMWHVLGLGYNPNVNQKDIEQAAVIHFNGNLKPWLEIGIPQYRHYWTKYVDYDHVYLRECNINP